MANPSLTPGALSKENQLHPVVVLCVCGCGVDGKPRKEHTRFWSKVRRVAEGCWEWQASRTRVGYGQFFLDRAGGRPTRMVTAHRYAFQLLQGPVPDGLVLDHLCRNRICVRPDHLEPVTNAENIRRGEKATARFCKNGHAFTAENTYIRSNGCRSCRRCGADRARQKRAQLSLRRAS